MSIADWPASRLSRPCRAHPGKDTTYVLGFINSADEVLTAFRSYHTTAELEAVTDPNLICARSSKLDALGFYDDFLEGGFEDAGLHDAGLHDGGLHEGAQSEPPRWPSLLPRLAQERSWRYSPPWRRG
jgi:hypothetical protein